MPSGKQDHMPVLTQADQENIINDFIPKAKIDYIAIPYALNKRDFSQVRDLLG